MSELTHCDGVSSNSSLFCKNIDIEERQHKNYNFTGKNSLCLIRGEYFYINYVRYTDDKWM